MLWLVRAPTILVLSSLPSAVIAAAPAKDAPSDWSTKTNENGKVVQELKIEAPSMTEEDQYGYNMPDRYKCDACKAVMYHLDEELRKKHPKSRRMKQWEYTDAFDDICKNSFQGYGIKLIDQENTLSGPGLKENENTIQPGSGAIQMGGDSWTKRLAEICRKTVYEKVGEDELYDSFYKQFKTQADGSAGEIGGGISSALCFKVTKDCKPKIIGPKTPPKKKADDEEKSNKKKKEKKEDKKKKDAKKKEEKPKKVIKIPIEKTEDAQRRDSKAKTVAAAATASVSDTATAKAGERQDVQTFLRTLAVKHGLDESEYVTARTGRDWEKLMLAMSSRIFSSRAEL